MFVFVHILNVQCAPVFPSTHVVQSGGIDPSLHFQHVAALFCSQAAQLSPASQAEKEQAIDLIITNCLLCLYIPVSHVEPDHPSGQAVQVFTSALSQVSHDLRQQFAPENPSGHASHLFSSSMSQAEQAALQATRRVILQSYILIPQNFGCFGNPSIQLKGKYPGS